MVKIKRNVISTFLSFMILVASAQTVNYATLVNPFIGTGGHGHTFPGSTAPFGMVQVSPDTRLEGWDGCSGYHYGDSVIYGFSHTHLSGTGCSDYGDVLIMPMMGEPNFSNKVYSSHFSHSNEKAHAGFYSVHLDDEDIDVELTATTRVGLHKYVFNKEGKVNFILDLLHRDKLIDGRIRIVDDHTIEGYRRSKAWASDQRVYYRIQFMKSFTENKIISRDTQQVQAAFEFNVKKGEELLVKVSLSAVDNFGARMNMETETPIWAFDRVQQFTEMMWNSELGKIQVKGGTNDQQVIFYTALYHTFIQPNTYSDVDGRYRGRDLKVHKTDSFIYYTVFSLWDTFRAAHPLYNIVQRKRNSDFIKTFLAQYMYSGRLPVWELSSNETDCMIGYHSASVIADAYAKGIRDFDLQRAVEALERTATWDHYGLSAYMKQGYISVEDEYESVSKTLEYAYDDWCIMQLESGQNKKVFEQRQQTWKNHFDNSTGFMRARKNGGWYSPFDPAEVNNNYTEANAWQYSFFVPHDVRTLIAFHGGEAAFDHKLDQLFSVSSKTSGRDQADISGMIGQYAHGNEPSHHMAYLYNYVGKASKTQMRVHQILTELYKNAPDGLAGNEDCGQMSAWFVMSSIGLYAVCPGSDEYQVTAPLFDEVIIHTEENHFLIINSKHRTDKHFYIRNIQLNHSDRNLATIRHNDLFGGGEKGSTVNTLDFVLIDEPNDKALFSGAEFKGLLSSSIPRSLVRSPIIETNKQTFTDSLMITMRSLDKNCAVYYRLNDHLIRQYTEPFLIDSTSKITAFATDTNSNSSGPVEAFYYKKPYDWNVQFKNKYAHQYTGGGDDAIINGLHGDVDWRKGNWQGYEGTDFEAVIDLKKPIEVESVSTGFLQDSKAWILFPKLVEVSLSKDGIKFIKAGVCSNDVLPQNETPQVKNFEVRLKKKMKAKFIKIRAVNFGTLPVWHIGGGGKAWIFVDEVEVK